MGHAWLDSLSEDWVSQPGSDTSVGQLPPLEATPPKTQARDFSSRKGRRVTGDGSPLSSNYDPSVNILSERSTNEIIASRNRKPSKLSREVTQAQGTEARRAVSATSNASVVHNTVNIQISPEKVKGQTPEWKRRLLHGEIAYGEQRDLFCSAAAGLQDMFKPPQSMNGEMSHEDLAEHEVTLPSSPPIYPQRVISGDIVDDEESLDGMDDYEARHPNDISPSPSPRRQPRGVQYRPTDDDSGLPSDDSFDLARRGSPQAPTGEEIYRDESCLTVPSEVGTQSRKPSGQSDTRNEDFSPIFIGKHSNQDGQVDFAPIEVPVDQLKQKLERLRINQMLLESQIPTEEILGAGDQDDLHEFQETTHNFARHGAYINLQRGGRSAEGSFRYRALSPSMGCDTSEMLPEESLQASTPKQFPTVRTMEDSSKSPSLPRAPFPSPQKTSQPIFRGATAGGSPLKLFGPYDTFTNQTLLRRISQFEEGTSGSNSRHSRQSITPIEGSPSRVNRAFIASPSKLPVDQRSSTRRVSQFGEGDLEGFEFNSDLSLASIEGSSFENQDHLVYAAPTPPVGRFKSSPGNCSPLDDSEMMVRRKRDNGPSSSMTRQTQESSRGDTQTKITSTIPDIATTPRRDAGSEGKRPRTSPSKDPTPKRRRTLHKSDIAYGRSEESLAAADDGMPSMMHKKHKNTRPGHFELASPEILAMRTILRPRSPTPTQRSSDSKRRQSPGYFDMQRGSPNSAKSPSRALRGEGTPSSRAVPTDTDRKPSIRTQDFVDQAAQIMAMIRSQVRPQGLDSVEESEAEAGKPSPGLSDDSGLDSTNEPFDRPPSRDGAPMSRLPQYQDDPDVVRRLMKYQEISDMGDIVSSSLHSAGLANDTRHATQQNGRHTRQSFGDRTAVPLDAGEDFVSDIPNVRISMAPIHSRSPSKEFPSNHSTNSTNRSYQTGSSRGSDSRKVIMPESVSHLIPDRVGSMYLDKDNNIWIKKKEGHAEPAPVMPSSDDSEDDPFASIPDLTVDMTKEMQHLRLATGHKQGIVENASEQGSPVTGSQEWKQTSSPRYVTISPEQHMKMQLLPELQTQPKDDVGTTEAQQALDQANDSPELPAMGRPAAARRRNLTIAFSSPIASIIQDVVAEDLDSLDEDDVSSGLGPELTASRYGHSGHGSPNKTSSRDPGTSQPQRPSTAFVPRPVSRIDEQDEDSTVEIPYDDQRQVSIIGDTSLVSHNTPNPRQPSLSFLINRTPGTQALSVRADESAMIGHHVGKLSLSPLSEFTLNNSDQSFGFEVSYVMGHRHMETGDGSKRVMSMTIRELVDKLSEAEPREPFWEDMTELAICDKRLTSLHMLDEFCGKLVTLDASQNMLGHLDGVPPSVRQLKATNNMLTELTSWDHLMNLQYLDISGNEVSSLSALKNLVHLRSVKADNNHLTSLDGLDTHDGLLSLRARDNDIEEIDFAVTRLERLVDLDLGGNRISRVRNLDKCPSLSRLKLERNELRLFAPKRAVKSLRLLDVSDNCLSRLDVSAFPGLHTLHADRNCINKVSGFHRCRRLDSLSLREQHGEEPLDMSFLSTAYEVRKLFLSGNTMGSFEPQVDFLNLQLLDLANCGLRELPRMMGQLMPNLRTLNINFNAITDLSPLLFVPRVKKLLVAGNRLADSTAVTELLTEFPHLTQLDLRDNPVTQGFYAPVQVLVTTDNKHHVDPFTLPDADAERDETYARRLDQATKLRRRLHQVVFAASCKRLRKLDGLELNRHSIMARDELLKTLISDGLLPEIGANQAKQQMSPEQRQRQGEQQVKEDKVDSKDSLRSSRWNAEDSFA
jgi:Leucine-rich repeat (LRR) protein